MLDTLKNKNIFHFTLVFFRKPFTCSNNAVTPRAKQRVFTPPPTPPAFTNRPIPAVRGQHLSPPPSHTLHQEQSLQNKVQFTSKPSPFRKRFSIHLTRKGVSFFGNTWALPLSRAFNIPFNRGALHILSAHLPSETQHGMEIAALAQTQTSVFIQHNSTLHRDANLGPRIDTAEFMLPRLHH